MQASVFALGKSESARIVRCLESIYLLKSVFDFKIHLLLNRVSIFMDLSQLGSKHAVLKVAD